MEDLRTCRKCGRALPRSEFRSHKGWGPEGLSTVCKEDENAQDRVRRAAKRAATHAMNVDPLEEAWTMVHKKHATAAAALNATLNAQVARAADWRARGWGKDSPERAALDAAELAVVEAQKVFEKVSREVTAAGQALAKELREKSAAARAEAEAKADALKRRSARSWPRRI